MPLSVQPAIDELARSVSRREAALVNGEVIPVADAEELAQARETADPILIGQAHFLRARAEFSVGAYENAVESAAEGLLAFANLDPAIANHFWGIVADAQRTAGTALLRLGRVTEGLPRIEAGVRIAREHLDAPPPLAPYATVLTPAAALLRGQISLGVAFTSIREIDEAIDAYEQAARIARTRPDVSAYFIDDVLIANMNLAQALHHRIKRRRDARDVRGAAEDTRAARAILEIAAISVEASDASPPSAYSRSAYYAALGEHRLITARPYAALQAFESQFRVASRLNSGLSWCIADAYVGMAQALVALEQPVEALAKSDAALAMLDRHDEPQSRIDALLVRAAALKGLGDYAAAFDALEAHHRQRNRAEALAARHYASQMSAQIGLERARAEAASQRGLAVLLETLVRIGQEITAQLCADDIFAILARHVATLLNASAFAVWLVDATQARLRPAYGVEDGRPLNLWEIAIDDPHSLAAQTARERSELYRCAGPEESVRQYIPGSRFLPSVLFEPLIVDGRILGVISLQSERRDAFDDDARLMFRTLSTYAAIALDNAGAYAQLEQTANKLRARHTELRVRTDEFERLSMTDALTGLPNRRYLNDRAGAEIANAKRRGTQLAVAIFDLDHFKRVNDTYGHAAGDTALQHVANVAKESLRPADLIARIGGEEFALLLPGAGLTDALAIAERIRASISATPAVVGTSAVPLTASFGVAVLRSSDDSLDDALSRADAALYAAKQAGRDRVHAARDD